MFTQKMLTDALRYMRVPVDARDNDELRGTLQTVQDAFESLEKFVTPRCVWGKFDIVHFDGGFKIAGSDFYSRDLSRLTARSNQCFLIAATLGSEVDRQIILAQKCDMLYGLALDACASVKIDSFCDAFVKTNIAPVLNKHEFLTSRFSPGYGDAPLKLNEDIIVILNAHKNIGLSITNSYMMTPVKSITAVIGIFERLDI